MISLPLAVWLSVLLVAHPLLPTAVTLTTLDPVGNRRTMTDGVGTHAYTYDPMHQLTSVDYPSGFGAADTTYTLDGVGNRLKTVDGGTTTYVPNSVNQYVTVGGVTFTYDLSGNLTFDGLNTYTYDRENHLVSATGAFGSVTYTADALGRRTKKVLNGTTTRYVYDGDQLLEETNNAGTQQAEYVYGQGIDEPLRMERGGQQYSYFFDGLGSVIALTNSAGTVVESTTYDVYGRPLTISALGNRYLFTGREYDQETGLYNYRARYYPPRLGRFLQRDPIKGLIDFPQTVHPYTYAGSVGKVLPYFKPVNETNPYLYTGNNPITRIDPLGLWYIDVNISYSWHGAVLTGGVIFSDTGIYSYGGGGGGWPGPGFSLTWSPHNPTPGWNFGAQAGYWGGGQWGTDLAGNPFWEVGFVTPGGAVTGYYVEPFQWPWTKGGNNACGEKKK